MTTYRHADHAGNEHDVAKHAVLWRILSELRPTTALDTHAGQGFYPVGRSGAPYFGSPFILMQGAQYVTCIEKDDVLCRFLRGVAPAARVICGDGFVPREEYYDLFFVDPPWVDMGADSAGVSRLITEARYGHLLAWFWDREPNPGTVTTWRLGRASMGLYKGAQGALLLSDMDRRILAPLTEGPQTLTPKGEQAIQDLVQRGYVSLSRARCGPLGIYTGESVATLTEAGRLAMCPVKPVETSP